MNPPYDSRLGMRIIELLLGLAFSLTLALMYAIRLLWRPAACLAIAWTAVGLLRLMGIPVIPNLWVPVGILLLLFWAIRMGEPA